MSLDYLSIGAKNLGQLKNTEEVKTGSYYENMLPYASPEEIIKCLNCDKPKCNNCIENQKKVAEQKARRLREGKREKIMISSEQRKVEAKKMYDEGMSCTEISRKLGVSRQRVHQIVKANKSDNKRITNFQKDKINATVFPNIRLYIFCNELTIGAFLDEVLKEKKSKSYHRERLYNCLCRGGDFNFEDVLSILEVTGLTFEEAFKRD